MVAQDPELTDYTTGQIARLLAQMLFGRPFGHLPVSDATALVQAADVFVRSQVTHYQIETNEAVEVDCMDVVKWDMEA